MSMSMILLSLIPTTLAALPSNNSSTALTPILLANILSNAVGLPPLWTCPSTVTLKSAPVSFIISFPKSWAFPTPSAKTIILCLFPLFWVVFNLLHTSSTLKSTSGTITVSAPPARPAYKAKSPQCLPITSIILTLSWEEDVSLILPIASIIVFWVVSNPIV